MTSDESVFSGGLDERLSKSEFLMPVSEFLQDQGREVGLSEVDTEGETVEEADTDFEEPDKDELAMDEEEGGKT